MINKLILLTLAVLLVGCTINKKYVEITVEDGTLTVQGNVDPKFMRENTQESQENTPTISPIIDIAPLECANACHAAYAGELFNTKLQDILKDIEEDKDDPIPPEAPIPEPKPPVVVEPEPPPVVKPDPPPTVRTDTLKIHSSRNAPYWQYYAYKSISAYPKRITVTAGNHSWVINLTGRTRPGYVGKPGADHSPYFGKGDYIIKQSEVGGRGMTVLIHEKFGKHQTITVSY